MLYRRQKANGVARHRHYKVELTWSNFSLKFLHGFENKIQVKTAQTSQAVMDTQQHSISYTLSRNQAVIVEYSHDDGTDLFQVGIRWQQK